MRLYISELWVSFRAIVAFTLVTGFLYPLAVTLVGKLAFPHQSGGSLIVVDGNLVGSELIAQSFAESKYFWARPSAVKYDAASSGASNLSPASAGLQKAVREREQQGLAGEMRYASGSGLDPHISPQAAKAQVFRIARARNLSPQQSANLERAVDAQVESLQFGFLGQPRVNVLRLNLLLDKMFHP